MQVGVCVASHIGDVDYVVRAEELGYTHAWLADSQMIWSDCYATLALAAVRTERIRIGTGVAVTGTRPAPVTAASIATINALAPGRTFLGVGAGNTALRIMGEPPQRIAAFDRYLETLRPLLRGEEAMHATRDGEVPIRHLMPDQGFVRFEPRIPLYVSGFGPRSLALAGRHGDGAVIALPLGADYVGVARQAIEAGALAAGRELDDFPLTALTQISVLDPG
ncbi:MAG: LLM class flavin-dependent oxidoreductase, partial [Myxococcota bacterium]